MRTTSLMPGEIRTPRAIHIYRVTLPFSKVNDNTNHDFGWLDSQSVIRLSNKEFSSVLSSDIITIARMMGTDQKPIDSYCNLLRSNGALLVYETDDDLTNTFRDVSIGGTGANCLPFLCRCDAFTVSTQPLADHLRNFIPPEKPIFVLPNKLDIRFFSKQAFSHTRKYQGTFNILLSGTRTHGDDWTYAYQAIREILNEFPNVRLLVGGFHPDYVETVDRVELMPFMPYRTYPTMLAEADIVVAAIDPDDGFNRCKSAVKAMEAWAAKRTLRNKVVGGAAVIATDSVVYSGTVIHERNGLLVEHSVDGYYQAIKRLINDSYLRVDIQKRGYLDAVKRHGIDSGWRAWLTAYNEIRRLRQ